MKHIQITNLEQFTTVFAGTTLKLKRELLAEAALLTSVALSKDKDTAVKLATSLDSLALDIEDDAKVIEKRMLRAIDTNKSATEDFINQLKLESKRLLGLAIAEQASPKKQPKL